MKKEKTIKIKNATKKGFIEIGVGGVLDLSQPNSKTRRGRVKENGNLAPTLDTGCEVGVIEQIGNIVDDKDIGFKNPQRGRVYSDKGIAPALSTMQGGGLEPKIVTNNTQDRNGVVIETDKIRIRKLTPKECFRLQGFPDEYFERARTVNSDNQLYKQAGNSVTVNVIYEIARRL